ncbi:rhodanese-related sulfurtransferase [Rhizobium sp. CRIBSB]|nr:rhodanese-related sulfurtransferase [Rhizobium sp. CRIBSB]
MRDAFMGNEIAWLEQYLLGHANGEWEHDFGITIQSSDNPGWVVTIDLSEMARESLTVDPVTKTRKSETDWITLERKDHSLIGTCGPANLAALLRLMKSSVEQIGSI